MQEYKVPQDVEADDKLLGPFSFRQFIYLIIATMGIALAWGLSRLFIPLAIIPLPIILLFGALALPLRKDQPMEVYLAAILSFYLKPRKRLWVPDGRQELVEITAPRVVEVQRAKDLSQNEAERRLSYLADIVDTRGWSVRGVDPNLAHTALNSDVFYEAEQAPDILDERGTVGQSFDRMITAADQKRHDDMMARMRQAPQPAITPTPPADPYAVLQPPVAQQPTTPAVEAEPNAPLQYNPYPNMRQSVIDPQGNRAANQTVQPSAPTAPSPTPIPVAPSPTKTTSEKPISPDIINLANNSDLSVETIAREAHRIEQKEQTLGDDEVVISLH